MIAQHFGPGTPIARSESSSPWVEVLASRTGPTMLVSKLAKPLKVTLDGRPMTLEPYAIRLVPDDAK